VYVTTITRPDAHSHQTVRELIVKRMYMDGTRLAQITQELPDLLDEQMDALSGRNLKLLSNDERAAYERRKRRILQLRSELERLRNTK
jgi:hypothetical protein